MQRIRKRFAAGQDAGLQAIRESLAAGIAGRERSEVRRRRSAGFADARMLIREGFVAWPASLTLESNRPGVEGPSGRVR